MDIFFIRHAKARERNPALPDAGRELVEKGRRETLEAIPYLKKQLKPGQEIHIFTSPAARALQTTQLIAKGLGLTQIPVQLDGIYTGETEALFRELAALPEASCALVVGHEPYLGSFCGMISGESISFKKSGMAGFSRTGSDPLRAARFWLHRAEADLATCAAP